MSLTSLINDCSGAPAQHVELTADEVAALQAASTPEQQYAAALAAGVALSWSASTSLNGTYAIAQDNQNAISAIMTSLANGLGLPGGGSTFVYLDASGAPHAFNATTFPLFAKAVRDYVYEIMLAAAGQGSFPSATISITG